MQFKWYLGFPNFNKITIFNHQDYWLRKILFQQKDVFTIPALPIVPVFISLSFFLFLIKSLFKKKKPKIRGAFLKQIYYHYLLCIIDYSKTKIIITYIDNSGIFHNLNKLDSNNKRRYFAVQNGARHKSCAKYSLTKNYKIYLSNFFCFSLREKKLFKKYNHQIQNFIPVGNIKSSFFFRKKKFKINKKFDICLVSQWRNRFQVNDYKNNIEKKVFLHNKKSIHILNLYLRKLALLKNYKIAICLRSKNEFKEIEYYNKIFHGVNYVLIQNNPNKFSTFKTILKSNLTMALNSTALSEVFGLTKVLWVNILNNINFEMPEAGISYFNKKDFKKFMNKVEYLLRMNINDYKNQIRNNAEFVCIKKFQKPAHIAIKDIINKELANV